MSRVSWKLSRTVLRGADGGNAARLLDKKIDEKTKQPYAIAMRDAELFAFAGLWDKWTDKPTGHSAAHWAGRDDVISSLGHSMLRRRFSSIGDHLAARTCAEQSRGSTDGTPSRRQSKTSVDG